MLPSSTMEHARRHAAASLIVLAGGTSRRMGRPKQLLPVPGGTLIEHVCRSLAPDFRETLVVGGDEGNPDRARAVPDLPGPRSPLLGIYSGLLSCRTDLAFVLACDMPFVPRELAQLVLAAAHGADVAVPMARGHHEPLCAAYRRTALPAMERALARGTLKLTELFDVLRVRRIPECGVRGVDPTLHAFVNLNTSQDLAQWTRDGTACGATLRRPLPLAQGRPVRT